MADFMLGYCYAAGKGCPVDLVQAERSYARAVERGLKRAVEPLNELRVYLKSQ